MFNIGGWEFLVILVLALVVLGPERLPTVARQVGQALGTMRAMAQSFQTEFEQAVSAAEAQARLDEDAAGASATASADSESGPEPDALETEEPDEGEREGLADDERRLAREAAAEAAEQDTIRDRAEAIASAEPDRSEKRPTAAMTPQESAEHVSQADGIAEGNQHAGDTVHGDDVPADGNNSAGAHDAA